MGKVVSLHYLIWADALGVEPRAFVRELMAYYDPVTHGVLFRGGPRIKMLARNAMHRPCNH